MSTDNCDLCLNLLKLVEILKDEEKMTKFLEEHKLLSSKTLCESCGTQVSMKNFSFRCDKIIKCSRIRKTCAKTRCRFKKSALMGTFFEGSQLSVSQVLTLAYFFTLNRLSQEEVRLELGIGSSHTLVDWYNFSREVLVYYFIKMSVPVGGPGVTVEIDETKFGNRKYDKGELIEGQWIFSGIEKGTKSVFMVPVSDQSRETLEEVVKEWINPGSVIISHCLSSFASLSVEGYTHVTVNQSKSLGKPHVPVVGRKQDHSAGYLALRFLCEQYPRQNERFHKFLEAAADLYPPKRTL